MHQVDMKKREFINNKVIQQVVVASVDKAKLITHINVIQLTLEGEDSVNAWKVRNQTHLNVIYNLHFPFIEYASFTCEWALCGNLCKHQVILWHATTLLMMISSIIVACGNANNCGGLNAMFAYSKYLQVHDGS